MITSDGLKPGIVLWIDSEALESAGGVAYGRRTNPWKVRAWLVCSKITPEADTSEDQRWVLVPLFSRPSPTRKPLSTEGRSGHARWTTGEYWFDPENPWSASGSAISFASSAGGDSSKPGDRNTLDAEHLPSVVQM